MAIGVQDRATKIVGALKGQIDKIDGKVVQSHLRANDSASKAIKSVTKSLEASDKAAAQAFKSMQRFEGGAGSAERGVSRLRSAMQRANTSIETYSRNLETARKKTEHLSSLQGPAAGIAAVTGGIIGLSLMQSSGSSRNLQAALNAAKSENDAAMIEAWVKGGTSGNRSLRALTARKGAIGAQGIDALSTSENLEFLDLIVKHGQAGGATEGEIESAVEALYTGSADTLNDILGGFGVSNDTINAQIEAARKEDAAAWEGYTDEMMMTVFAVREYTKLMKERGEVETDSYTQLSNNISDIRDNLGEVFGPVISMAATATGAVAKLVTKYPIAKYLVAAGLAVGFLGASILLMLPGLAVATSMVTVAGLATAGWAVGLAALAAVLVYAAKKTGILGKAWDSLQDFDLSDAGKLAFKLAFPPAMLYAILKHVPGMANIMDRVEVKIGGVLTHLKDFKDRAVDSLKNLIPGWLKNIWDRLKDIVIRIKEALITALGGLIPESVKQDLDAIASIKEGQSAGLSARGISVRSWGIQRKSDDGYKVAQFTPAEGLSMNQMARAASLMGDRGYLTWPELMALSAEDQALFGWGGSTSEMTRNQMLAAGWTEHDLGAYDSMLGMVGGDRATAEDVAGVDTDYTPTDAAKKVLGDIPEEVAEKVDSTLTEKVTENPKVIATGEAIDKFSQDKSWVSVNWNSDTPWINKDTGVAITDSEYGSTTEGRGRYFNAKYVTDEDLASYGWRRTADGFEKLASGGGILSTGLVVGHEDEEFSPADVVHRTTAAERLLDRLDTTGILPSAGSSRLGDTINVTVNVTVNGVKESFSKFDLARLISQQVKRELGQFKT